MGAILSVLICASYCARSMEAHKVPVLYHDMNAQVFDVDENGHISNFNDAAQQEKMIVDAWSAMYDLARECSYLSPQDRTLGWIIESKQNSKQWLRASVQEMASKLCLQNHPGRYPLKVLPAQDCFIPLEEELKATFEYLFSLKMCPEAMDNNEQILDRSTIELVSGETRDLTIYAGQNPHEAITAFCHNHELMWSFCAKIREYILYRLEHAVKLQPQEVEQELTLNENGPRLDQQEEPVTKENDEGQSSSLDKGNRMKKKAQLQIGKEDEEAQITSEENKNFSMANKEIEGGEEVVNQVNIESNKEELQTPEKIKGTEEEKTQKLEETLQTPENMEGKIGGQEKQTGKKVKEEVETPKLKEKNIKEETLHASENMKAKDTEDQQKEVTKAKDDALQNQETKGSKKEEIQAPENMEGKKEEQEETNIEEEEEPKNTRSLLIGNQRPTKSFPTTTSTTAKMTRHNRSENTRSIPTEPTSFSTPPSSPNVTTVLHDLMVDLKSELKFPITDFSSAVSVALVCASITMILKQKRQSAKEIPDLPPSFPAPSNVKIDSTPKLVLTDWMAAIKIQRLWRGYFIRVLVDHIKRQHQAHYSTSLTSPGSQKMLRILSRIQTLQAFRRLRDTTQSHHRNLDQVRDISHAFGTAHFPLLHLLAGQCRAREAAARVLQFSWRTYACKKKQKMTSKSTRDDRFLMENLEHWQYIQQLASKGLRLTTSSSRSLRYLDQARLIWQYHQILNTCPELVSNERQRASLYVQGKQALHHMLEMAGAAAVYVLLQPFLMDTPEKKTVADDAPPDNLPMLKHPSWTSLLPPPASPALVYKSKHEMLERMQRFALRQSCSFANDTIPSCERPTARRRGGRQASFRWWKSLSCFAIMGGTSATVCHYQQPQISHSLTRLKSHELVFVGAASLPLVLLGLYLLQVKDNSDGDDDLEEVLGSHPKLLSTVHQVYRSFASHHIPALYHVQRQSRPSSAVRPGVPVYPSQVFAPTA